MKSMKIKNIVGTCKDSQVALLYSFQLPTTIVPALEERTLRLREVTEMASRIQTGI